MPEGPGGPPLPLSCQEHANLAQELITRGWAMPPFRPQPGDGSEVSRVWAFGLRPDGFLSYYVGLDWLDERAGQALRVTPKLMGLDYLEMFQACLASPEAAQHLGNAYDIRPDSTFIPGQDHASDFTPFLLVHFLTLLEELVKKPLKKGYVARRENLTGKIKGKILMAEHLRANVFGQHPDRMFCGYQDYSTDCAENRLLHSAYRISLLELSQWGQEHALRPFDRHRYVGIAQVFHSIGVLHSSQELQGIRGNPLYRAYGEAIRLAKLIFRIQGYRDRHPVGRATTIPPYVIDMAKLFELYVYQSLATLPGRRIAYQSKGKYGYTDFLDLDEQLVLDAKYKLAYQTEYKIEDIRQVAGYARDLGILKTLGVVDPDHVIPCLIIYPDARAGENFKERYGPARVPIPAFHKIQKLAIKVPLMHIKAPT
jgi:5-methylcytosine-specific restriction enzyme subunit McrC